MTRDPLSQLRDIHLPLPVSWWPPAPGWWIVSVLLAAFCVGGGYFLRKFRMKRRYRKFALQELERLAGNPDGKAVLIQTAVLVRRVAVQSFGSQAVARLAGDKWLQFLDQTAGTDQFTQGPGAALGHDLYRPVAEVDGERIIHVAAKWIKDHKAC